MEKHYLPIDGKNMELDIPSIELLFGCAGTVADSFDHNTYKYAFYNTGQLCQVSYSRGSEWLKVECFCPTSRREDILGWLKTYLVNGMDESGYGTDIRMLDGFFFAHFYEKNQE